MYKLKKIKKNIGGFQLSNGYMVYTQTSEDYKFKIFVKKNLKEIFISDEEKINKFYLFNAFLAYSPRTEKFTRIVNLETLEIKQINETLNNLLPSSLNIFENIYYSTYGAKANLVYDLTTGVVMDNLELKLQGDFKLNEKSYLITAKDETLYKYDKINYNLTWEKNLSQETKYKHWDGQEKESEIKKVYSWNNKILVLTTCVLICLDFHGNILYEVRFPDLLRAQTLVVNENKAYIYNYHDYVVVDLEKGELILHKEISSFVYQGEKYNNFAQDLTYHQGLLFHSVNSKGLSFVVAINPGTGETIWRQHVTGQSINSIRFHKNKMYILDGGSSLHIFDKEAKSQNNVT